MDAPDARAPDSGERSTEALSGDGAPPSGDASSAGRAPAALTGQHERMLLAVLAAAQFTNIVDFMIVMPLGPQLMASLEIDPERFGAVIAAYSFAAGAAGLAASAVIDRFGRKSAFLSLYLGFILGTVCCGLATSYWSLVASRTVTGGFGGVMGGMALAVIGDVFPEERRGRATGVLMSAFALASVLGVPLGIKLGAMFDWHAPFLALAALGVVILSLAWWAMPALPAHAAAVGRRPMATLIETLTRGDHWRAFSLIITVMLGSFAVIPYVSTYLVRNVGIDEKTQLMWVFVAGGACTLVTAPLAGRLADRFGRLWVYRLIAPASAALMLVITHLPRVGLPLAAATVAGLMVANSSRMVAAMALVNDSVEPRLRGGFMTANSSLQHMASGLGVHVASLILAETADGELAHYGVVGLLGAVTTLASIGVAALVRPLRPPHPITVAESVAAAAEVTADADELL